MLQSHLHILAVLADVILVACEGSVIGLDRISINITHGGAAGGMLYLRRVWRFGATIETLVALAIAYALDSE